MCNKRQAFLYAFTNRNGKKDITFDRYRKASLHTTSNNSSMDIIKCIKIRGSLLCSNTYFIKYLIEPNVMNMIWEKVCYSKCLEFQIKLKSLKRLLIRLSWLVSKLIIFITQSALYSNINISPFKIVTEITNYLYKLVSDYSESKTILNVQTFVDNIIGWYDYKYDVLTKFQDMIVYKYNIDNNNIQYLNAATSYSSNSNYNRLKNLSFFNTRYLKKNVMQLIDNRPFTKWNNYIDTTVVKKMSSLYHYNYDNKVRSSLERNIVFDILFYISPFYNININRILKSKIIHK